MTYAERLREEIRKVKDRIAQNEVWILLPPATCTQPELFIELKREENRQLELYLGDYEARLARVEEQSEFSFAAAVG